MKMSTFNTQNILFTITLVSTFPYFMQYFYMSQTCMVQNNRSSSILPNCFFRFISRIYKQNYIRTLRIKENDKYTDGIYKVQDEVPKSKYILKIKSRREKINFMCIL